MHDWWPDEVASAGPEHLDATYVAGYDRKTGYDPAEDLEVLDRHGLGPDATVVDLGAGTGALAVALAPRCRRVTAVDVSPAMVAALRRRVGDLGIANVSVVQAGFLSYEHAGDPVDVVVTKNALHHLPDFWKGQALVRIADVLRPGGTLLLRDLVYDVEPAEAPARLEAWMAGGVDDPAVGWTPAELAEHARTEFSTYSWLLDALLDRTGFEVVEREFRRSAYGTYVCRRRTAAVAG